MDAAGPEIAATGSPANRAGLLVLALDTAADRTAVALSDGGRLAVSRDEPMQRGHSDRLMVMIEAVMAEADRPLSAVGRIAVTVGPGSFTGIRVGIAAARGLALALEVPAVGVDGLTALAHSLPEPAEGPILTAIDARRGEIYAALFDRTGRPLVAPFAADAEAVWTTVGDGVAVVVGSGAAILGHQAAITGRRVPPLVPLAGPDPFAVARLSWSLPAQPPQPLYLRAPDAKPQVPLTGLLQ